MLLKGLVFQSMPQATMIAAIAAHMRGPHRDRTPPLSEVRNYLKTEVAFDKGNLKIGKLIMEEIARQNACQAGRVQARHVDAGLTIEMTVRQSPLDRNGERTKAPSRDHNRRRNETRINALATSMFAPIDQKAVKVGTGPQERTVCTNDDTLSPVFRTLRADVYYSHYLVHRVPDSLMFQLLHIDRYPSLPPVDMIRASIGALITRGHSVRFDRQGVVIEVDGARLTPLEVVQKVQGGELLLVEMSATTP